MHFDIRKIKHIKNGYDTDHILNCARNASKEPATVGKVINGKYTTQYDKWCTAEFVDYSSFKEQVDVLQNHCANLVKQHYNVDCLDAETHFLHYKEGTGYKSHIDGQFIENDTAKRGAERDIACIVYLNDDFDGGEICFDLFDFQLKPNKNDILMFPTTWEYVHGVNTVSGERYAIVFWFKTNPEINVESAISDPNIIRFLKSIIA